MNTQTDRAKEVFLDALEIGGASDRLAFLDGACAGDSLLRREVEDLLAHHEHVGSFLATVPRNPNETRALVETAAAEEPGAAVGPYRLLEQLGEGGMGMVFVAEQSEPVRRRVALKLIKPGMDSRQVVARFEQERQALALMDHPNIATVLDAGTTAEGRPFFVMELVRGAPITDYCDRNHLTVRARLALFVQVCQAVQHAHQKGIIHRDIKPSNVLVTERDGRPVAKVIDFGIAKAIGQQLTDKTVYTRFMQLVGTPLYMSPEQAGLSGQDVDTRTDVYALGVMLYELLTGTTPFDKARMRTASFDEMRRIIREEEPARPSARLSTLEAAASTVSANRGTDARRLARLVRGELDWVVMKALEKDRSRRYESAASFAADVQRYLADEPVQACPPSAAYRARKFVRRNKVAVGAASALVAVLLLAVAGLALNNYLLGQEQQKTETEKRNTEIALELKTKEEEKAQEAVKAKEAALIQKNAALVEAQTQTGLAVAARALADQNRVKAREAVHTFLHAVATNPQLRGDLTSQRKELLKSAITFLNEFVKQQPDNPDLEAEQALAYGDLGFARSELGDLKQALADFDQEEAILRRLSAAHLSRPEFRAKLAGTQNDRAKVLAELRHFGAAEKAQREALGVAEKLVAEFPEEVRFRGLQGMMLTNLGVLLKETDRPNEALPVLHGAIAIRQELLKGQTKATQAHMQSALTWVERALAAAKGVKESATIRTQLAQSWVSLGATYHARRELGPAEGAFKEALGVLDHQSLGPTNKAGERVRAVELRAMAFNNLGNVQFLTHRYTEAEKNFRESIGLKEWLAGQFSSVPRYRYETASSLSNLGNVLDELKQWDDARAAYERAVRVYEGLVKDYPAATEYAVGLAGTYSNLAKLVGDRGGLEKSLPMLDKAVAILEPFRRQDVRDVKVRESLYAASYVRATTLSGLNRHRDAQSDWDRAVELAHAEDRDDVRLKRASNLLNLKEYDRAVTDARAAAESPKATGQNMFRAACTYALAAGAADKESAEPLAARAVVLLREALVKGYERPVRLGAYRDLAGLRGRADFQNLLRDEEGIYRETARRAPKDPVPLYHLGYFLSDRDRLPEAADALRKAIALRADYAEAHDLLGIVLADMGDLVGAEAAHRKAAESYTDKEGIYRAHTNLGGVLGQQQRQPEAVEVFSKAIDLRPRLPAAHFGLGLALGEQGKLAESIAAFRAALACDAKSVKAYGNLGFALMQIGDYAEGKAALQQSHDLLPPNDPARPAIRRYVASCDRLLKFSERLPAVLEGTDRPDGDERAAFAEICLARGHYPLAALMYEDLLRPGAQPRAPREDAARAAARAGCGPPLPFGILDRERVRWREQAHDWLVGEALSWNPLVRTPQGRARVLKTLALWQRHPDFAGVRDKDALARLPEAEQARWRKFWSGVDALLARLQPKAEPPEKK